jgi:hypothetical protein
MGGNGALQPFLGVAPDCVSRTMEAEQNGRAGESQGYGKDILVRDYSRAPINARPRKNW